MTERRIGYAKDKADLIQRLVSSEDNTGPFKRKADVLVFAAAIGMKRKRRQAIAHAAADPIRQEVFDRQGYDTMMNLLALHVDGQAEVLAESEEMINQRAKIFEEYANGGLEILQVELKGAVNLLETIVLLIYAERRAEAPDSFMGFDLSRVG